MNWKDLVRDMWDDEGRRLPLPIEILHTNIITQPSRTWSIAPTIDIPTAKRYKLEAGDKRAELMLKQVTDGVTEITLVPPAGSVATDESDLVDLIAGALWRSDDYHKIRLQKAQGEPTANQVEEGQMGAKPSKGAKKDRFLGLRIKYVIAAILLTFLIIIVSLILFPDWARSNLTLLILLSLAFATATSFIASFRKAFE